jgi:hypothetical protein
VRPAWTRAFNHDPEGKTTARRPVFQSPRLSVSPPRGTAARRGVSPRSGELGCGVTPTPGAPDRAAWGSHGAGPPPFNTVQRRDHVHSSHGDGGAQEHERSRSSIRRGTAVLRLDGQHPGRRVTATRLDIVDPTQEGDQGGEESRVAGWVAHGGAAMESWPARWRGVRRRGRCSRRWSSSSALAPRPQLVHVLLPPAWRGVVLGVSTASRRCSGPRR